MIAIAATETPTDSKETVDRKRHGRQEHRKIETFNATGRLPQEWDGLIASVARVSRLTWHKDTKSGLWIDTEEVSWYACQDVLGAAFAGAAIRAHWGTENRHHHVLDVSFFEDHSRIRTMPGAFARIRRFALNILRANGAENIARELYINALDPQNALNYPRA